MRLVLPLFSGLLFISACAVMDRHAVEKEPLPEGVENCLQLRLVDRMEILDEWHILFFMRDQKIYNNHLPGKCSGLRRNDTIMYRTPLNQICSIDTFTVLENFGGGFMPGVTCTFGKFYPATQDEVDALKAERRE